MHKRKQIVKATQEGYNPLQNLLNSIFDSTIHLEILIQSKLERVNQIKNLIISFGSMFGINFDSNHKKFELKNMQISKNLDELKLLNFRLKNIQKKNKKLLKTNSTLINKKKQIPETTNSSNPNKTVNQFDSKKFYQVFKNVRENCFKQFIKYSKDLHCFYLEISKHQKKNLYLFSNLQNQFLFRKFIKREVQNSLSNNYIML